MAAITERQPPAPRSGVFVEAALALTGAALTVAAFCADQAWFDRHFLPVFFLSRSRYVFGETCARVFAAAFGLTLALLVRPIAGRLVARNSAGRLVVGGLRIVAAGVLALVISELGLRVAFSRATEEPSPKNEPFLRHDARLGWVWVPSRVAHARVAGRDIAYVFDSHGYRTPALPLPVNPRLPTILFTGESIMAGYGLRWEESVPGLVGSAMATQAANLAVFAYADDQSYLRLARELPRFTQPRAVVILFSPGLVFRDFDDDRPHLEPGLVWSPAAQRSRIEALLRFFVPYHSRADIDRRLALVRAELQAGVALAHSQGAAPLIVVPQFGREDATERTVRERILDAGGLPYVQVRLDPTWRLTDHVHPDARGARVIADAIVERLDQQTAPPALLSRPIRVNSRAL